MQPQKGRLMAGIVVFIGVVAIGVVIYTGIHFVMSLPSGSDVADFTKNFFEDAPTVGDVIKGTMIPDGGTKTDPPAGTPTTLPTTNSVDRATTSMPKSDWLTPGQRKVLATLGIDESDLPATLTPELEACLVTKIGEERFAAVKGGATPTIAEGLKAMGCL
jgi:hypothetical protein